MAGGYRKDCGYFTEWPGTVSMTDAFMHAKSLVSKLTRAGYIAYFAGGWVRDYVMGHPSEDIDIATNASSAEIMDLFPKTLLVGLAFGIVIVTVEGHAFEVATFRKDLPYLDGRHPQGIEIATPLEDAQRRDFTINGLFYDPLAEVIYDYVHGREDIRLGIIRTIGDPHERFFEDRLRLLRAFRFAARFGFAIESETQEAIREHANKLFPAVALERVWQEFNKMAAYPRFDDALVEMHRLSLLPVIFPEIEGLHLKELRRLVSGFPHFPPGTPAILYLMEVVHFLPLHQRVEIAKRLKASNKEVKLLVFKETMERALQEDATTQMPNLPLWAELFGHADWALCFAVCISRRNSTEREHLWQTYEMRMKRLAPHIERLKSRSPLVSAAMLEQEGIKPGKHMGQLLKAAERMAIDEDRHDSEPILAKLKTLPLWQEARCATS